MSGYGFSLWLAARTSARISYLIYNHNRFPHTPHVTVATNLTREKVRELYDKYPIKRYMIKLDSESYAFESHYPGHDPLHGWGFDVAVKGLDIPHGPHLTIGYDLNHINVCPKIHHKEDILGELVMCDTRSINPWEWQEINS